jgi:hypothetical protein
MGNLLSIEDDDDERDYYEERVKPEREKEKKKRRGKARTVKRKMETLEDFGLFDDVDNKVIGSRENDDDQDDVIENIKMETEYEAPKQRRKKRNVGAVSRRRKVAWDDDGDA